jgi:RHS repeat-associated protein
MTCNCLKQMALNTVLGSFPTTYVHHTWYDASGRAVRRAFWLNGDVETRYTYNAWSTQGGRLYRLQSGLDEDVTTLQNLFYTYDAVGNVLTIKDFKAGSPQTQTFEYDLMNRLINADVTGGAGGNGNYSDAYNYAEDTGNLALKGELDYVYGAQASDCPGGALSKVHAVVKLVNENEETINSYCYNVTGNMIRRTIGGQVYTLSYDEENRLAAVYGAASASFVYNGDGQRVKSTAGGVTTVFIGNYYQWTGSTSTAIRYYYAGSQRIAMRAGTSNPQWILGDHLSSTTTIADATGGWVGTQLYRAWGEDRLSQGSIPTKYRYTGQYDYQSEIGLYFYGARWYDSSLGRFAQADTVVPDLYNPLDYDRYSYARNNPIKYNDPSGHFPQWTVPVVLGAFLGLLIGGIILAREIWNTPPIRDINGDRVKQPTDLDMTKWTIARMKEAVNSQMFAAIKMNWASPNPVNKGAALKLFVGMMRTGGYWDFKVDILLQWPDPLLIIRLGGRFTSFQAVANLAFGYIGSAAGLFSTMLKAGGGAAQVFDHHNNPELIGPCNTEYFCDQPYDSWWVGFGIYLYGLYGDNPRKLTQRTFSDALEQYIEENGEPPCLDCKAQIPPNYWAVP